VCTTHLATVVVRVHDAAVRGDRLRDLVGVARTRQAGADIEELPDAPFAGQVPHCPGEELAVLPDAGAQRRQAQQCGLCCLAVDREVVLAPQSLIIDWATNHTRGA